METGLTVITYNSETFRELLKTTLAELLPEISLSSSKSPEELITQKQAIKLLGVSATTLIEWRKRGVIPFKKYRGRVYYIKADLIAAGSSHEKYTVQGRKEVKRNA